MRKCVANEKHEMKRIHEVVRDPEAPECSGEQWRPWSSPTEFVHHTISNILTASNFAKEVAGMVTNAVENKEEYKGKRSNVTTLSMEMQRVKDANLEAKHGLKSHSRIQQDGGSDDKENRRVNDIRVDAWQRNGQIAVPLKRRVDENKSHGIILNKQYGGEARRNVREDLKRRVLKSNVGLVNRQTPESLYGTSEVKPKLVPKSVRAKLASTVSPLSSSSDSRRVQVASSSSSSFSSSDFRINSESQYASCSKKSEVASGNLVVGEHVSSNNRSKATQVRRPSQPLPTPKIQAKVRSSSRSARVFTSWESPPAVIDHPVSKFAVRVVDATNANRPWILTPSRPAKPAARFVNRTMTTSKTPSKSGKTTPLKLTKGPVSNSLKVKKLSPFRSLKFQPANTLRQVEPSEGASAKGMKLKSQSKVSSGLKKQFPTSSIRNPRVERKQGLPSVGRNKGCQSIHKNSVIGKQDISPARPLPSLITRLPSWRRDPTTVPGLISTEKSVSCPLETNMIAPLSLRPVHHAGGQRAAWSESTLLTEAGGSKRRASFPRPLGPLDRNSITVSRGQEGLHSSMENENGPSKMDMNKRMVDTEVRQCKLCVPGCGSSVWPVLRRSWSCGNENICCCTKTNEGLSCLKHMKGWMNTQKNTKPKDQDPSL